MTSACSAAYGAGGTRTSLGDAYPLLPLDVGMRLSEELLTLASPLLTLLTLLAALRRMPPGREGMGILWLGRGTVSRRGSEASTGPGASGVDVVVLRGCVLVGRGVDEGGRGVDE
jgi:hypothetical protein